MKDLRTLDLNLLKAFDVLMDEKNVSKAAERLAITQPAMSGILVRLRESFDDPLFVRVQRGVVPTNRALALAQPIKQRFLMWNSYSNPVSLIHKQQK